MGSGKSKIININDLLSESHGQEWVKISLPFRGDEPKLEFNIPTDYSGIMTNFSISDSNFRKVELCVGTHIFMFYREVDKKTSTVDWKMCNKIKIPLFLFNSIDMKLIIYPNVNCNSCDIQEIKVRYLLWSAESSSDVLTDGIKIYSTKNNVV
jgi:hypothetical protein